MSVHAAILSSLMSYGDGFCGVTAGWENINVERGEYPPKQVVWLAPADGFDVSCEDGAQGSATVSDGMVVIRKTNAIGRIVVTAPTFFVETGKVVRFFADVTAFSRSPMATRGYLTAFGNRRTLSSVDKIGSRWFAAGGEYMRKLVNSAPGMTYRKYSHFRSSDGAVTPAIVVEGIPSESTWRCWGGEDLMAAQENWNVHFKKLSEFDRRTDRLAEDSFERALKSDVDHTARIVVRNGVSRFLVDERETPPIVFKPSTKPWREGGVQRYSGKPLQREGVRVGVLNLRLGDLPGAAGPWSAKGFDLQWAVSALRDAMRVGDESCFILSLGVSAYREFTEKEHPDEVWRRENGSVVMGNSGSAIPDEYNDGGRADPGDSRWPWVSYSSPAWRRSVKDVVVRLVAELKRTGLAKRIIGVHFYGYHDGQFAVPVADHSSCAKADYAKYLAERNLKGSEPEAAYAFFMKQTGFRALEDFSRAAKETFGKPMIAVRWCMLPFNGNDAAAYDVGSFLRSEVVDVIVPQPTYTQRLPALAQGVRLPCASLHLHGKMMWYEFDLRTYAALEGWAQSVVATKGLGQSDDLAMWQTVFRKHAGIMMAQRMGWWFYDMADGWFYPPEIAADCGWVYRAYRELSAGSPDSWHPDLALVVDESALASYNRPDGPKVPNAPDLVMLQWPRTALAGVPYDFYMVDDLRTRPDLVRRYKAMALCAFNEPDDRQRVFQETLARAGVQTFVVPPGGYSPDVLNRFARDAGCYVATRAGGLQVDMNGDFVSVHAVVPGCYDFRLPFSADVENMKTGRPEVTDGTTLKLAVSAGETCWFRLRRR